MKYYTLMSIALLISIAAVNTAIAHNNPYHKDQSFGHHQHKHYYKKNYRDPGKSSFYKKHHNKHHYHKHHHHRYYRKYGGLVLTTGFPGHNIWH
jgi:ABC-type nickel/cobalt efflux system permease component RcnA